MFQYMEFEEPVSKDSPESESTGSHGNNPQNEQPFTWRGHMKNFLHSKPCHIAVIVLVLVDSVLVITEILLDLHVVEVHEESEAPEIVHYCSISILSIFMIEIAAKLIADWEHFWSHKMEIFDAIVVVVAFACDIGVLFVENEAAVALGLLVLLRLWRVVRLVNGIILTVKNEGDERVHALKDKLKSLEEKVEGMEEKLEKKEKNIQKLRDILTENGIEVEIEPDPPLDDSTEQEKSEAVIHLEDSNIVSVDA
uniref:voltage-gated hydrogen channel 1-like isoform X2 n=1 Tax=Styela clava TaxID=7725 RepID=UPI001939F115|nr:voltage-gated hydrogen channel 1-like isoform X2 [Styela clava]